MYKFLERLRMKIKKINKVINELENYDNIYWDGKLSSAMIVILSLLVIGCFILASMLSN